MDSGSRFGNSPADIRSQARQAVEKHRRADRKGKSEHDRRDEISKNVTPQRPKTLTCYLCGQQFGSASIAIHERSCKKKFVLQQAQLPEAFRKELPAAPKNPIPTKESSRAEFDAYNDEAFQILNTLVMHRCPKCGRTFARFDKFQNHAERCDATVNVTSHGDGSGPVAEGGVVRLKWKSKHPLAKAIAASRGKNDQRKTGTTDSPSQLDNGGSRRARVVVARVNQAVSSARKESNLTRSAKMSRTADYRETHAVPARTESSASALSTGGDGARNGKERRLVVHVAGVHGEPHYQQALAKGIQIVESVLIPGVTLSIQHHNFHKLSQFMQWKLKVVKRNEIGHLSRLDREAPNNTPFVWTEVTTLNNEGVALQAPVQKYIGDHTDLFGYLLQLQRKSRKLAAAATADASDSHGSLTTEHQAQASNQLQDRDQSKNVPAKVSSSYTKSQTTSDAVHSKQLRPSDQDVVQDKLSTPVGSASGQNNQSHRGVAVEPPHLQVDHETTRKEAESSPMAPSESGSSSSFRSAQENERTFSNPALSCSSSSNHDNDDTTTNEAAIQSVEPVEQNGLQKSTASVNLLSAGTDCQNPRPDTLEASTSNEVQKSSEVVVNNEAQAKDFPNRKEQIAVLKSKIVSAVMNDDPDGAASAVAAWQTLLRT